MTGKELLQLAEREPFTKAAIISMEEVVFDAAFRPYCEQNFCGMYGVNYSCPPACGTPEEMQQKMQAFPYALVLQSQWTIDDYHDKKVVRAAKAAHNAASQEIVKDLRESGNGCLLAGCGCCMLCDKCEMALGRPCRYPHDRYSCMSAYCIYVRDLAEKCGMEYTLQSGRVTFFSMIGYR